MTKHIMKSDTATPKDSWCTPQWLFKRLDDVFNFNTDLAADELSTKCQHYFSIEDSAFNNRWVGNCFCNPPFSELKKLQWTSRAFEQSLANDSSILMILPVATETRWWQATVFRGASSILFFDRRINYEQNGVVSKNVTFASVAAIYSQDTELIEEFKARCADMGYFVDLR